MLSLIERLPEDLLQSLLTYLTLGDQVKLVAVRYRQHQLLEDLRITFDLENIDFAVSDFIYYKLKFDISIFLLTASWNLFVASSIIFYSTKEFDKC